MSKQLIDLEKYPVKRQTPLRKFLFKIIGFNEFVMAMSWILFFIIAICSLLFAF